MSFKNVLCKFLLNLIFTALSPLIEPFLWLLERVWTLCLLLFLVLAFFRYWYSLEDQTRMNSLMDIFVLLMWSVHFGPSFIVIVLNYILLQNDQIQLATLNSIISFLCLNYSPFLDALKATFFPEFTRHWQASLGNKTLWECFLDFIV